MKEGGGAVEGEGRGLEKGNVATAKTAKGETIIAKEEGGNSVETLVVATPALNKGATTMDNNTTPKLA